MVTTTFEAWGARNVNLVLYFQSEEEQNTWNAPCGRLKLGFAEVKRQCGEGGEEVKEVTWILARSNCLQTTHLGSVQVSMMSTIYSPETLSFYRGISHVKTTRYSRL